MSLTDLAQQWDETADRLLQTATSYRSKCNAALKSGYVAKAAAFKACAAALREALVEGEDDAA